MFDQDFNPAKRRVGGALFVILLHVGILYALVSGLGRQMVEVIRAPLETRIVDEAKPPPPEPPRPPVAPPKLSAPPPPFIPLPEVKVQTPPPANAITAVTTVKPAEPVQPMRAAPAAPPAPAPAAGPVRVAPVVDAAHSCKRPEYPSMSRRMEETGVVVLQFLIDVDGKVVDSRIDSSSGHERLDNAARDALQLCRFKPGTVDGKPERAWAKLRYEWKLED